MTRDQTTISVMGEDVPASHQQIPIDQLRFLPDNPRVYAAIRDMQDFSDLTPAEKQDRIYERLLQEESSVKNLIPQIRRDGGLQEPIIVRWDTQEVIEGNSRLAAYRKLSREDPNDDRWTDIKCLVVTTLTDDQQTRLLGQTHLHGRTEWSKYAKALSCFRWVVEEEKDISTLAELYGITANQIKKNVKVIQLMQQNGDRKLSNFSYYDVLVRNRIISSEIANNKPLRDTVLSQIKTEEFTSSTEMRDRLPTVIAKPRILRKYERGDMPLEDAYDRAKISDVQQRLKKIRERLDDVEQDDIKALDRSELKAVEQVVRRINQGLKRVSNMIENKLKTDT